MPYETRIEKEINLLIKYNGSLTCEIKPLTKSRIQYILNVKTNIINLLITFDNNFPFSSPSSINVISKCFPLYKDIALQYDLPTSSQCGSNINPCDWSPAISLTSLVDEIEMWHINRFRIFYCQKIANLFLTHDIPLLSYL